MKVTAEILGATGLVGQRLLLRLAEHPWFEVTALAASDKWVGKRYAEAVSGRWIQSREIPEQLAGIKMKACEADGTADFVFSALGSQVALRVEPEYAEAGAIVCSNASAFRQSADVPLIIPEINAEQLKVCGKQEWSGKLITNTNCAVSGVAMALAPLEQDFGLEHVSATTLQSISGAGLSGLGAMAIQDNLIPDIPGEAKKIEKELCKVLARDFSVSVQTWRAPVRYGHSFSLDVTTTRPITEKDIRNSIEVFNHTKLHLPSSPLAPLIFCQGQSEPSPALLQRHDPMAVLVGGLRIVSGRRLQLRGCVDNLERGAAGAAVLNAELALQSYPNQGLT